MSINLLEQQYENKDICRTYQIDWKCNFAYDKPQSGTKTGTNTSRGVQCGDIFEKCDFGKVSNSNYLQT